MKNLFCFFAPVVISSVVFASGPSDGMIPQISATDSPEIVLTKTSRAIREIYRELGLGQIQIQSNNVINELRSEVVTRSESHKSSVGLTGKISGFFFGGSGDYNSSSQSRLDYTQIIATNPLQVLQQESAARRDFNKLRSQLIQLMNEHEEDFIVFKELGLLQASAAYQMAVAGQDVPWTDVMTNMQLVTDVNFEGLQTVSRCLITKHAKTLSFDSSDESAGLKFHLLFFSVKLGGSDHQENYYRQMAYTEKQCSSSTNTMSIRPADTVFAINMSLLDIKVAKWKRALEQIQAVQDHSVSFPTWGSPYYQQ